MALSYGVAYLKPIEEQPHFYFLCRNFFFLTHKGLPPVRDRRASVCPQQSIPAPTVTKRCFRGKGVLARSCCCRVAIRRKEVSDDTRSKWWGTPLQTGEGGAKVGGIPLW
ncbi:hypothetical protein CDAR_31691 [Caerostris darwini]|uniref:Uncharacterized protein n=1 Tax=Caerostris darwini TaxID=1538125 RepID=A0AAV4NUN6_9ARAC|nr:hypothetical protein CDAR_31691 [Caerostris darwini]